MKNILIVIPTFAPGSGHQTNARYIRDGLLAAGYKVDSIPIESIRKVGSQKVPSTRGIAPLPFQSNHYDLMICPGNDLRDGSLPAINPTYSYMMHLPPPFCSHLCHAPYYKRSGNRTETKLSSELPNNAPFKSVTGKMPEIEGLGDYRGYKRAYFPDLDEKDVHFIVTYINTGAARSGDLLFKDYEEHIIILNFGRYMVNIDSTNVHVKSIALNRVSQIEFEDCLMRCTVHYPAITDGANTIGTLQSLELPYYDLIFNRVLKEDGGAFLNEKKVEEHVFFQRLKSLKTNADEFQEIRQKTKAYYAETEAKRNKGRMLYILDLVKEYVK